MDNLSLVDPDKYYFDSFTSKALLGKSESMELDIVALGSGTLLQIGHLNILRHIVLQVTLELSQSFDRVPPVQSTIFENFPTRTPHKSKDETRDSRATFSSTIYMQVRGELATDSFYIILFWDS